MALELPRYPTRPVRVGSVIIGDRQPIVVQSMTATRTQDIDATVAQVQALAAGRGGRGADRGRQPRRTPQALAEIRRQTTANLSVDLQENYRLAEVVAPHVDKIRYNPGPPVPSRAATSRGRTKSGTWLDVARDHDCALRVGVNCGSVDPAKTRSTVPADDSLSPMLDSALEHCELLDDARVHPLLRLAEGLRSRPRSSR